MTDQKSDKKYRKSVGTEMSNIRKRVETEMSQPSDSSVQKTSGSGGKGRSSKGGGKQAIPAVPGGLLQSFLDPFMRNTFGGGSNSRKKSRSKVKSKLDKNNPSGVDTQSESSWVTTGGDVDTESNSSSLGGGAVGGAVGGSLNGSSHYSEECVLCLGEYGRDQWFKLRNNNCRHQFCINCLHQYVRIEIQEGRINLKCPQCPCYMHPNDIEILSDDSHLLNLYQTLMVRRVLAGDPDTRWCPAPDCTFAVIAAGCASCPKIKCEREDCNYSFCYHCKAEWHEDLPCDKARAQRQQNRSNSITLSQGSGFGQGSELKECPRCSVFIAKMEDGSCNHMTCSVCGAEFCWLCMNEITDLHYLSPSGCTFWGKKQWGRKKKILWQLGTLIAAPVGIGLLAGISIPAMIIGIPVYVGRKLHSAWNNTSRTRRNLIVTGGVTTSILIAPVIAALVVCIGVPVLLASVYVVVPLSLCRSSGCLSDKQCRFLCCTNIGVNLNIDEEDTYTKKPIDLEGGIGVPNRGTNPSIGEISSGPSLSLDSGSNLDRDVLTECDRESASNTGMAGYSLTGSVASSYHQRLEVGADIYTRKKFSFSSERLSETVSLNEKSGSVSLAEDGTASTRALAGSFINYKMENVSVSSYRAGENVSVSSYRAGENVSVSSYRAGIQTPGSAGSATPGEVDSGVYYPVSDEISLRSLPGLSNHPPRSLSPIISISGEELTAAVRKSRRRQGFLDKQLSENGSLAETEDTTVEDRVRFDDKVKFIEANSPDSDQNKTIKLSDIDSQLVVVEETPEELAMVVSPSPKRVKGEGVGDVLWKGEEIKLPERVEGEVLWEGVASQSHTGVGEVLSEISPGSSVSDTCDHTPLLHNDPVLNMSTDMSFNVTNISIEHETNTPPDRQENSNKSVTIIIGESKTD